MSEPLIVADGLRKTYRRRKRGARRGRSETVITALADVSFTVERGELVGYIGPNGAGKSTTIKILAGILVPDGGACRVAGRVPWRQRRAHVADVGALFGQRSQLWWDLPVSDSLELLRDVYRLGQLEYQTSRDQLVDLLEMRELLSVPVRQLSLGQRMRAELAAALLHRPAVLFLDEPTIGLDAVAKLAVRQLIGRLHADGYGAGRGDRRVTTILTTHDLDDIEALCDRVLVIGDGRILFDGPLTELRAGVDRHRILTVDLEREAPGSLQPVDAGMATLLHRAGTRLRLRFDPSRVPAPTLIAAVAAQAPIRDLFVEPQPIDELVARLYRDIAGSQPQAQSQPQPQSQSQ